MGWFIEGCVCEREEVRNDCDDLEGSSVVVDADDVVVLPVVVVAAVVVVVVVVVADAAADGRANPRPGTNTGTHPLAA